MKQSFRTYVIFWSSQAASQLGSAMTGFALILWAYSKTGSAFAVSLMSFCSFVPYIIASLFAGSFVDGHKKKPILFLTDLAAAGCTVAILLFEKTGHLEILYVYLANIIIGFMNAIQSPATTVAVGLLVPKERLSQASGMDSFSGSLITMVAPVLAPAVYGFGGLKSVLAIDLVSFVFASIVLVFFIHIPEVKKKEKIKVTAFQGCHEGFAFLRKNHALMYVIFTMAVMNFLSRLTYENVLSPMILARSGNNSMVLGMVSMATGAGGIVGGIIVSLKKGAKDKRKSIYLSALLSFLLGDLLMGLGRVPLLWCIAGIAASLPIPFILAAQTVLLYERIPQEIQGRVFAVRNAIQYSTIPIGILLGGILADYVFEPFMKSGNAAAKVLSHLVGTGAGSGMAVMFLCTGTLGSLFCFWVSTRKEVKAL